MSGSVSQGDILASMRGRTAKHMIQRRDEAGGEMEILARVMNDPNPTAKEVEGQIRKLLKMEHITGDEAKQLLASIPRDPQGLRSWARMMFAGVMHQGIHAHAAFPRQIYPSPQDQEQQPPEPPQGAPQAASAPPVAAPQGPPP